ncbi:MAG: hypothetical protein HKN44_12095 [Ilumatobacter sp.]|nr:hypothetical protein [Ilumatobacter sp.]
MAHFTSHLADSIARRHGIVRTGDLIAAGFSHHAIRRMIASGSLVRQHRDTYRVATAPDTFEARCVAASLADSTATITGPAAGRLWGFRHVVRVDVPIVLVEHSRHPFAHGVLVRRSNQLSDLDQLLRPDGIRLARPPRAWFDCARDSSDRRFEMLTEWVIDNHTPVPELWEMMRRLEQRGRPGLARVRRVLSQRATWQRPAGSGLELRVLKALERSGVPELVRQHPIMLQDHTIVHPDGARPEIRWAVEVDHVTWHGGRFDAQYDKARDRQLRRVAWQVDRVTDQELRDDFAGSITELAELYRLRCAELAA